MAINDSAVYPPPATQVTPGYPYGEAQNESALDANDGYPWEKEQVNDWLGFKQALLTLSNQAPSGTPESVNASQFLEALSALSTPRDARYTSAGGANTYTLTNRGAVWDVSGYEDGMEFLFYAHQSNTGASTAQAPGLASLDVVLPGDITLPANAIVLGNLVRLRYSSSLTKFVLINESQSVPLPQGYVSGGLTIRQSITNVQGQVGSCRDAGNAINMNLSQIAKDISAVWAAGDGNGGRPAAVALTPNTWYRWFAIVTADGVVEYGWDNVGSANAANLIAAAGGSYVGYRQLAWHRTNGASEIIDYTQRSDGSFDWKIPVESFNQTNAGTSNDVTVLAPPFSEAKLRYGARSESAASGTQYACLPFDTGFSVGDLGDGVCDLRTEQDGEANDVHKNVAITSTTSQVKIFQSQSTASITTYLTTFGFVYNRGADLNFS